MGQLKFLQYELIFHCIAVAAPVAPTAISAALVIQYRLFIPPYILIRLNKVDLRGEGSFPLPF